MEFDWLRALVTVAFGALAGGITNRIAVWMIFHPYRPPKILGRPVRWLQGAVPKNQKRLADSVGGVVGGALLDRADLQRLVGGPVSPPLRRTLYAGAARVGRE